MPVNQKSVNRSGKKPRRRDVKFGASGSFQNKLFKVEAKANYALSQLNTEEKVIDVTGSAGGAPGGSMSLLNGLTQGISNTTRVGDSVRFKNISMRVAYQGHASEDIWYRYMIVRDRAPTGS